MGTAEPRPKLAAAKAKADDLEAKLHAGGDFAQLARTFSDGPTAAEGGDLGQFKRGELAKVLEDKTFALKTGSSPSRSAPSRAMSSSRSCSTLPAAFPPLQGCRAAGRRRLLHEPHGTGHARLSDHHARAGLHRHQARLHRYRRQPQGDQADLQRLYAARAQEEEEGGAHALPREHAHLPAEDAPGSCGLRTATSEAAAPTAKTSKKKQGRADQATMKPGKKEKIRYGQAPTKTLPGAAADPNRGCGRGQQTASAAPEPVNPLENDTRPAVKTRYSARAKQVKHAKVKGHKTDAMAPAAPDAAEVSDRQTQAGPLGLAGDTSTKKKKKSATTTTEKTRLSKKKKTETQPSADAPLAPAPQSPAPASQPQQ